MGRMTDKDPDPRRVVIIGAGPAGLTAAYQLKKAGVSSIVVEKDDVVGGISRTVHHDGYHFDIGGHRFFTKVRAVDDLWREILPPEDFLKRDRLSRIYFNRRFFDYPLKATNALLGIGIWNSILVLASYARSRAFPIRDERTFEDWVCNRFGRRLYGIFFKTYTEKVWGIPCTELSADWAAQRIQGLSLVSAVKNALLPRGVGSGGGVIKTLIDSFDYPKRGPGMMWERAAEKVSGDGCEIHMRSCIERIFWSGDRVIATEASSDTGTTRIEGSEFISTMPIRELVAKLDPEPPEEIARAAARLSYRDFLTVALIVDRPNLFPDHWIYVHDTDVKVGRVQNFKNWSPFMVPDASKSCVGLEYFCFEGDGLWTTPDDELVELAKREMDLLGLIPADAVESGVVVRMPKAYPVYDEGYADAVATIRQFVDGLENLHLVGRNGMHKYNNQDHSMLTAMLAVENILGAEHDIWAVNTDQDYHETVTERDVERQAEFETLASTQPRVPTRLPQPSAADRVLQQAFGRLHKGAFGTAVGSISGATMFAATAWLVVKGGNVVGPTLGLLSQFFPGYSVTWPGAFAGAAYGFALGFALGWSTAGLRSLFLEVYLTWVRWRAEAQSLEEP
jgi:protoporphyrinogen oxidase